MRTTATKLLFLLAFIVLSSFVSTFGQRSDIADTRWKLVEAYGKAVTRSSAYFEIEGDRFTGDTGCNRMFGSVAIRRNGRIDLSGIGSTKRMCKLPPGSVSEATYVKGLNAARRYAQTGERLNLMDRRGRMLLRFRAADRNDDRPGNGGIELDDRKWFLESVEGRQTFAPITGVFVNFDSSRNGVGGNTGCNVFGGTYKTSGSAITITEVISTMRACEEDGRMALERDLLEGLRRADRYEIKGARLHLYRGTRLLLTFRGERK